MRTSDVTIAPMALQSLRKAQRWTQDELSRASGLSLRTIQRAEKTGVVSLSTLKSLAAAFEVNIAELENTGELPEPGRTQWYALLVGAAAITILAFGLLFHRYFRRLGIPRRQRIRSCTTFRRSIK